MNQSVDVLKVRVDMVESLFFGRKVHTEDASVMQKLDALDAKLRGLEKEVPSVKMCSDVIVKLHPFISDKKLQVSQINEKIDSLVARRDELQQYISELDAIRNLSPVLDSGFCSEIDFALGLQQLASIDAVLQPALEESRLQSRELDALLEQYEKAMIFISDVCQSWDEQVKDLERAAAP